MMEVSAGVTVVSASVAPRARRQRSSQKLDRDENMTWPGEAENSTGTW